MTPTVPTEPVLAQTRGFRWGQVRPVRRPGLARDVEPEPDLGALARFTGTFRGAGVNVVFRPQNAALTPTPLPRPAHGPDDNVLEVNPTEETLAFSPALGSIPNRGMVQGDVFLNGVPYLQTVNDVGDPARPVGIHFEPGVWLSVPPTTVPAEDATVVRMASVPHGTAVEAQGTAVTVAGGPVIEPVDITPFPIGDPGNRIRFPSQTVGDSGTFRVPQDLSDLVAAGTVTQAVLDDPNLVLRRRAAAQTITSTTVITIATEPAAPLFGGGTANIAFLRGDPTATAPNADAVRMSATFWVETVADRIAVPAAGAGQPVVVPGSATAGGPLPSFVVTSATERTADTPIAVGYPQIQYTQTVLLNFNGLSWPHVSVATLVPNDPVPVVLPASD